MALPNRSGIVQRRGISCIWRARSAARGRSSPFMRRCGASLRLMLRLMSRIEIFFETQMLHAAATAPHKLQGLYPDLDMPFDKVRGHRPIRRFGLHTFGDHWLIGYKKQRARRNVVGTS